MDTRHAVGCVALRGGVPCTCWLTEKTAGQTPLWLAVQRLRQALVAGRGPSVTALAGDVTAVLDAIPMPPWEHGRWPSKDAHDMPDEGGEA